MTSASWHARISCGRDTGAGFLVTERHVLTCAHVVARSDTETVAVSFAHGGHEDVPARVAAHGGWTGRETDPGDLAVLELDRPVPMRPAEFAAPADAYGDPPRRLLAYGFPKRYDEGTLAEYRATADQLIAGEWVQLEAWAAHGQPIVPGFSGAAVTLADTGRVVGMVSAAARSPEVRNGRMLPAQVMVRYWPRLADLIPTPGHTREQKERLRHLLEQVETPSGTALSGSAPSGSALSALSGARGTARPAPTAPQPQHLAEVILSGALTAVPGTAGSYAFRPGVRELLLRTLPRTARGRTSELLARVGALIDARAGVAAGEFRVAVPGPGSATAGGEPFAAVREESVRRLGGTPPHQTRPAAGAQSPSAPVSTTPPSAPQSPRATRPTRQSGRQPSARVTGPADRRPDEAADALVRAPYVLIGFDGPLVRLYTGDGERQATRELAALLAELRDPQAALSGEPLSPGGTPAPPLEGRANPLDLLRAVAGHPLGADLRRRLNRIEERAVSTAASTPFSDALITTLSSLGRRTAVVADNAPSAVWKYLQAHGRLTGLVTGGVHGRSDDLTRLMPDPDCLLRALAHLGAAPEDAVLVGSSVAELTAAKAVGLRFLGYTRSEPHRRRLVGAGCELTTASWAPLLRALPPT
ncbi:trypsin-like peptidase domain-containing protein [Streptomyces sp. NPDC006285]|uniref:trypsin-like peptidase domain-containing protein n=1 Tax=Streptomyces sp. NPDC006285 TaxID=3364742 RepID=UPI0036C9AF7E